MSRTNKTLEAVLRGTSDGNVGFHDLLGLLRALEFAEHIRGSHHIFSRDQIPEIINLQPLGSKAKAYQVRQVRQIIVKYRLGGSL